MYTDPLHFLSEFKATGKTIFFSLKKSNQMHTGLSKCCLYIPQFYVVSMEKWRYNKVSNQYCDKCIFVPPIYVTFMTIHCTVLLIV